MSEYDEVEDVDVLAAWSRTHKNDDETHVHVVDADLCACGFRAGYRYRRAATNDRCDRADGLPAAHRDGITYAVDTPVVATAVCQIVHRVASRRVPPRTRHANTRTAGT